MRAQANDGVLVVGATNRVSLLDDALLRKGRFDISIYMGRPSTSNRFKILQVGRAERYLTGCRVPAGFGWQLGRQGKFPTCTSCGEADASLLGANTGWLARTPRGSQARALQIARHGHFLGSIRIATEESILDAAMLRAQRWHISILVNCWMCAWRLEGSTQGHARGLQVHAKGKPIPRGGDEVWESDALLHRVAELTIGYAGADLANLLNEAAILMVGASSSICTRTL